MSTLTVFTPTYNRAKLLERGYQALLRQTSKDFVWLIIDDGSTDNTAQVVSRWIEECTAFEIRYIHKENGGLFTGYNVAIEHADTELMVCIDSDDFMPDDAVEKIVRFWQENGSEIYAGIIGLDVALDGNVLGDPLPNQKSVSLIDLLIGRHKFHNLDQKIVVRTEIYKQIAPMPSFGKEKDFNPHYMHIQISKQYDFLVLNENLCFVEYQADGMTRSIFKQYVNSPRSFLETRKLYLSLPDTPLKFRLKNCIHYVSSSIFCRNMQFMSETPKKFLTALMIPFGILLTIYVQYKARKPLVITPALNSIWRAYK